jgi:hypothetical protein
MVLLGVLTVVGAAAVMLSSRERSSAMAKTRLDSLNACANAAQAKIWAEMAQYGLGYLGSAVTVTPMDLPDGTRVVGPAHYGQHSGTMPTVTSVTFRATLGEAEGSMDERDCTNSACGLGLGRRTTYVVTALCRDQGGREYEVELALKFAL